MAARTRFDKIHALDSERYHLILLCENETGYKNLIKLVSEGFVTGFYTKPRIDRELLEKYHEGLIALSACIAGEIPRALLSGDYEGAKKKALWYRSVMGENNFFLEIQDHGLPEQKRIIPMLAQLSRETGIPLVATNACTISPKRIPRCSRCSSASRRTIPSARIRAWSFRRRSSI